MVWFFGLELTPHLGFIDWFLVKTLGLWDTYLESTPQDNFFVFTLKNTLFFLPVVSSFLLGFAVIPIIGFSIPYKIWQTGLFDAIFGSFI